MSQIDSTNAQKLADPDYSLQKNILVDNDGKALLSDFGLASIRYESKNPDVDAVGWGSVRYLAPEVLAGYQRLPTCASDCYAFSMTLLQMATLEAPFAHETNLHIVAKQVCNGSRPACSKNVCGLSLIPADKFWTLLTDMWAHNPRMRPKLSHVASRLEEILSLVTTTSSSED